MAVVDERAIAHAAALIPASAAKGKNPMQKSLTDDQITVGMQVEICESQRSAPLNGAVATVVAIGKFDHAPMYTVEVYGARYDFRAYDLREAR